MENKYFTPDITDIRVGYEAEFDLAGFGKEGWQFVKFQGVDKAVRCYHEKGLYRVPYLTKEQIEAEGWEFCHRFEGGSIGRYEEHFKKEFSNGYYSLAINQFQFVTIHLWNCIDPKNPISQTHWRGILPSINELRYITKLLGI